MKLTEDEVIECLAQWLKKDGWDDIETQKGHSRGIDLTAYRNNEQLIVEAKGAKGSKNSHLTTRDKFDCGQIKTHLGVAIIKVLSERNKNPEAKIAIAQPDDQDIRNCVGHVIPELKKLGITFYWVSKDGVIKE